MARYNRRVRIRPLDRPCRKLLKERGAGRLISIDHDERYAEGTRTMLREAELEDRVTVITAQPVSYDVGGRHVRWYDRVIARTPAAGCYILSGSGRTSR